MTRYLVFIGLILTSSVSWCQCEEDVISSMPALPQVQPIQGVVKHRLADKTVEGWANHKVELIRDSKVLATKTTDKNGYYSFNDAELGTHVLRIDGTWTFEIKIQRVSKKFHLDIQDLIINKI